MNEYFQEIRTVETTVISSSGAVTVKQASSGGPKVELATAKVAGLDELRLAEEIEHAVLEARESQAAKLRARTDARGPQAKTAEETPLARALSELAPEIVLLEGIGVSAHGHVRASSYGDGDLVIQFRNNVVRRTDVDNEILESEVNESISRSIQDLRKRLRECYRQRVSDAGS